MWYHGYPQYEHFSQLPFYLTGIGRHELQPPIYRPDGLPRHQFLFAEHGTGMLRTDNGTVEISENSGFYLAAEAWHEYYPTSEIWDVRWISCGGSGVENLCHELSIESGKCYPLSSLHSLDNILREMRQAVLSPDVSNFYLASSYVNPFIVTFCVEAEILQGKQKKENIYENHMEVIQDYIEENYMRDIPLGELCKKIAVTPQHMCRIFQKSTGKRPVEFITEVRLRHVKEYLEGSDYSIEQIAKRCGFQSADYMRRIFRRQTGLSPREYREEFL